MALILIADDDPTFCGMLADFLAGSDYETAVAPGVAQLSVLISQCRPDAAVVDIQMPSGGGPAAVKLLRERLGPGVPIIVCSGMPVAHALKWFPNVPRLTAMQKPLDLPNFGAELARLLAGS
jgi:CheY-like chemotaxis protein